MRITILGCGPSSGVPAIGGRWGACDPKDPRNRRRRSSILVEEAGTRVLVDTSPDLRAQLLDADVRGLEAVLLTHEHADHVHGLDDLRAVNRLMGAPLPLYSDTRVLGIMRQRFAYAIADDIDGTSVYKPMLVPKVIDGPFHIGPIPVTAFDQDHGHGMASLGFRFGDAAYSTDVVRLDEAAFAALEGVRLWIVDCFQDSPHGTHSWLEQTLRWIARVAPERAVLTHMSPALDYQSVADRCPPGVVPAHDGLVLDL